MLRRLQRCDRGFTLIELLVVVAILPIVIGAITLGLTTTLKNKTTTTTRLNDSHDAQITSAYFVRDVKSAEKISTASGDTLCGVSSYLLALRWSPQDGTTGTDSVVYSASGGTLIRTTCGGHSSRVVLAHGVFPNSGATVSNPCTLGGVGQGATNCAVASGTAYAALTVTCSDGTACTNSGLTNATAQSAGKPSVDYLKLSVREYDSTLPQAGTQPFVFNVTASPQGWNANANHQPGGSPSVPALDLIGTDSSGTFNGSAACQLTVNGVAALNNPTDGSVDLGTKGTITATGGIVSPAQNPVTGGTGSPPSTTIGPPIGNPYDSVPTPPQSGDTPVTTNSSGSLSGTLDGIYILNNGLSITGSTTLTAKPKSAGGHGVLLYVPATSPNGIVMKGTGNITLDQVYRPDQYQNISIWVDNGSSVALGGTGNTTTIGGVVYDPNGAVELNGGGGTGGVSAAGIAAHSLSCQGGGGSFGFTAGQPTSTVVRASPSPANDGQPVSLSAVVTSNGQPVTAGSVAFQVVDKNGTTTTNCTAPVALDNTGTANCTTGPLSAGLSRYTINAVYQGAGPYGPSTAPPVKESVLEPTATKVTTSAANLVSGNTAAFTATVTAPDGSSPQGTVTFAGVACTGGNTKALPGSGPETVTCNSGALLAGNSPYNVTATYADTSSPPVWQTSNDSTSVAVATASTTTTIVADHPSSKPSQTVTFTATVVPAPDAGSVSWTFKGKDGTTAGCSGTNYTATPLAGSTASCRVAGGTFSDSNAPYTVTAVYSGDLSYATSTGATTQNVAKVSTSTAFGSLAHGSGTNAHRWTDRVNVTATDGSTPTGTVNFYLCANTTAGCTSTTAGAQTFTGTLAAGTASSGGRTLTAGTKYCFNAVYQGTTDYASSTEPPDLASQCFTG